MREFMTAATAVLLATVAPAWAQESRQAAADEIGDPAAANLTDIIVTARRR